MTAEAPRKRVAVDPHGLVAADGDEHPLDLRMSIEVRHDLVDGNARRSLHRETIGAGRDGGEATVLAPTDDASLRLSR